MKKLIYCAAALAAMIFAGSCQQENLEPVAQENTVTYTVEIPEVLTKTIGDGLNVDELIYEVWKTEAADERDLVTEGKAIRLYQDKTSLVVRDGVRKAVVTLNLVQDQEYTILFWAQVAGTGVYNTDYLTNVHYAKDCEPGSSKYFSNQEKYAAFYAAEFVSDEDSKSRRVELKRPFAQLNIATANTADEYEVKMNTSRVVISTVATHFNVAQNLPGKPGVWESKSFDFVTAGIPTDDPVEDPTLAPVHPRTLTVNGQKYQYVAMNYVFANGTAIVSYEINTTLTGTNGSTTSAKVSNTVYNVPLQENYRTNIVGNLLTSTTEYEVIVDKDWAEESGDGTEVEVWDGLYAQEPPKNTQGQYEVSLAAHLAWIAESVNGTLVDTDANVTRSAGYVEPNSFAGKTFILTQDIDLSQDIDFGAALWTPIGARADHPFKGTFDGNGCTIKNLYVDMDKIVENQRNIQEDLVIAPTDGAGLFGSCVDATIKNVTVQNATVKGHGKAAVIVADAIRTKVNDCHVENATVISTPYAKAYASNVGAIAGYLEGEDDFRSASVTGCSVVDATVTANNNVAGVVGASSKKTSILQNTVTNVQVVADKTTEYTADVAGNAGKVVSHDATGNCNAENNNVDENTTAVVKVDSGKALGWQASNAPTDVVIEFGSNITGNATIVQKVGVNVVVDGCNKNYDGTIYLEGGNQGNSPETLTFKNINFKHEYGTIDFISADDAKTIGKRYAHNVTVEYCTFTGNSFGDVVPMRYRQTYNMTVKNCTATRVHSFMWATGDTEGDGIKISDVKSSGKNGVSFGTTANVVVENSEFNATAAYGYGVRVDASSAYKAQINNTKITAGAPVIMRKATGAYEMNISDDSELTSTEVYQIIVASNDYVAGKTLAAPANNYTLNTNGVEYVVYPDAADLLVASSVETLKTAISAAKDGDTIYLMDGVYDGLFLVGAKNITLKAVNAHQAKIAGRICVAGSQESVLTCEAIHFAVSENTSSLFGNQYYDKTKGYVIGNYSGSITVKNCKFTGMTDDCGAIYYYSYDEGKATAEKLEKLIVENCKFNGARAIRSRSNVSVTGSQFTGLENPCLQVLGLGDKDLPSTVVFTGNTSDVAISGVCIKTSNHATKNVTFNVAGNTNCNYITFDSKNLANLYPETYTYTGEVKTLSPEDAAGLSLLLKDADVNSITLLPVEYDLTAVEYIKKPLTIKSGHATLKPTVKGKLVADYADFTAENIKFEFNDITSTQLVTKTYGTYVNNGNPIVVVNHSKGSFEGCEFNGGDNYHVGVMYFHATSDVLTVSGCTFNNSYIYSKVLCNITENTFNLGGCPYAMCVWPREEGSTNSECSFVNNMVNSTYSNGKANNYVHLLSHAGPYANIVFNVQGNTGASAKIYDAASAVVSNSNIVATDGTVTFAPGSKKFKINDNGTFGGDINE